MDENSVEKAESADRADEISCPACGSRNVETSEEEYRFKYGTGEKQVDLTTNVPLRTCGDCEFAFLDDAAEELCHEAICRHRGVMTPSKIRALRGYLGFSQSEFAEITGLGTATLSRWERGAVIQNEAYDKYLYLLGFGDNIDRLEERDRLTEGGQYPVLRDRQPHFREIRDTAALLQKSDSFILSSCDVWPED